MSTFIYSYIKDLVCICPFLLSLAPPVLVPSAATTEQSLRFVPGFFYPLFFSSAPPRFVQALFFCLFPLPNSSLCQREGRRRRKGEGAKKRRTVQRIHQVQAACEREGSENLHPFCEFSLCHPQIFIIITIFNLIFLLRLPSETRPGKQLIQIFPQRCEQGGVRSKCSAASREYQCSTTLAVAAVLF